AFGLDIVVHRNAGNQVPIYVGNKAQPKPGQDRVSIDYIKELEKLTPIQAQGDGMRSFLGILLFTTLGHEPVMLVDEPEAFLHPPQARHLGNFLVSEGDSYQQLFVATHSGDVLRGMLSSASTRIRVLRLRRSGDVNITRQLDNSQIARVRSDPLLRYSNILDGLFHERVVVCESDADCRFYSAIMDSIFDVGPEEERKPDIMFEHCGGKERLPLVIRSLRELEVPISVVTDFDVLNDEQPLRNILEAAGGDWASILPDWQQVKSAVDGMKPELATDEVKREPVEVLAGVSDHCFLPLRRSRSKPF
ncbi:MAG: AAA family ATPase, partial [Terracidiphilus sp.]